MKLYATSIKLNRLYGGQSRSILCEQKQYVVQSKTGKKWLYGLRTYEEGNSYARGRKNYPYTIQNSHEDKSHLYVVQNPHKEGNEHISKTNLYDRQPPVWGVKIARRRMRVNVKSYEDKEQIRTVHTVEGIPYVGRSDCTREKSMHKEKATTSIRKVTVHEHESVW